MKNFMQWCEDNKLDLPVLADVEPAQSVDTPKGSKTKGENTKRTGYSANYPAAYVAGQYPHKYFNPIKATADLDKQNMGKK